MEKAEAGRPKPHRRAKAARPNAVGAKASVAKSVSVVEPHPDELSLRLFNHLTMAFCVEALVVKRIKTFTKELTRF